MNARDPGAQGDEVLALDHVFAGYEPRGPLVLRDVSLDVRRGECVALIGESGSGKTTAARLLLALLRPQSGVVRRSGAAIPTGVALSSAERRRVQPVFQHPAAALDPLFDVEETLLEPLIALRPDLPPSGRSAEIRKLLDETGLPQSFLRRRTIRLSGGEQQRLCIARALAADPEALVLDEPTSALDLALQEKIVELLTRLRRERGLSYLLVTHDLRLVRRTADRAYVLRRGAVVENGSAADVIDRPRSAYARRLVAAVPTFDPVLARARLTARDDGFDDSEADPADG